MRSLRALAHGSPRYDSGPNMTPLVDVVMVILIFLMLAGSFGSAEHFLVTKMPLHPSGGPVISPPVLPMPRMLDVFVYPNGNFTVSGRDGMLIDPEQLKSHLEQRAVEFGSRADVEVILRPINGDVAWDVLAPLYDAALRAGFKRICFAQVAAQ